MSFFDCKTFNKELENVKTEDGFASPLKLSVCTICGSLSSIINLNNMVMTLYGNKPFLVGEDDFIVININEITEEKDVMVLSPEIKKKRDGTDKKITVGKILEKNYPMKDKLIRFIYKPNSKKSKEKKKKGEDSFYNSVQIKFKHKESNIDAKVFPNGILQIAGSRTIEVANEVPVKVMNIIKKYAKDSTDIQKLKPEKIKIEMLNTNFKFNNLIYQEFLKDRINEESFNKGGEWRVASFDPVRYSGIKAQHWMPDTIERWTEKLKKPPTNKKKRHIIPKKVAGQTAVLIFRSGNVIITGAKSVNQLKQAYDCIVELVRRYRDDVTYEDSDDESSSDSDSD